MLPFFHGFRSAFPAITPHSLLLQVLSLNEDLQVAVKINQASTYSLISRPRRREICFKLEFRLIFYSTLYRVVRRNVSTYVIYRVLTTAEQWKFITKLIEYFLKGFATRDFKLIYVWKKKTVIHE